MDRIGLEILHQELLADAQVLQDSARLARERIEQRFEGSSEACGYQLNRFYNVLERGFERICESFENHFEKRGDYHEKLIERMTLSLPGIRPAFLPDEVVNSLRELKGFRDVFRHAYDLNLINDRLEPLVELAETLAMEHSARIECFIQAVRNQLDG
jgi:hypothetical protein